MHLPLPSAEKLEPSHCGGFTTTSGAATSTRGFVPSLELIAAASKRAHSYAARVLPAPTEPASSPRSAASTPNVATASLLSQRLLTRVGLRRAQCHRNQTQHLPTRRRDTPRTVSTSSGEKKRETPKNDEQRERKTEKNEENLEKKVGRRSKAHSSRVVGGRENAAACSVPRVCRESMKRSTVSKFLLPRSRFLSLLLASLSPLRSLLPLEPLSFPDLHRELCQLASAGEAGERFRSDQFYQFY